MFKTSQGDQNINPATGSAFGFSNIATLPTQANTGSKQCMLWRNNHLLIMAGAALYSVA